MFDFQILTKKYVSNFWVILLIKVGRMLNFEASFYQIFFLKK